MNIFKDPKHNNMLKSQVCTGIIKTDVAKGYDAEYQDVELKLVVDNTKKSDPTEDINVPDETPDYVVPFLREFITCKEKSKVYLIPEDYYKLFPESSKVCDYKEIHFSVRTGSVEYKLIKK